MTGHHSIFGKPKQSSDHGPNPLHAHVHVRRRHGRDGDLQRGSGRGVRHRRDRGRQRWPRGGRLRRRIQRPDGPHRPGAGRPGHRAGAAGIRDRPGPRPPGGGASGDRHHRLRRDVSPRSPAGVPRPAERRRRRGERGPPLAGPVDDAPGQPPRQSGVRAAGESPQRPPPAGHDDGDARLPPGGDRGHRLDREHRTLGGTPPPTAPPRVRRS